MFDSTQYNIHDRVYVTACLKTSILYFIGYEQTQEYLLSHCETYHIERDRRPDSIFPKLPSGSKDNDKQPLDTMSTHCPYIKTHEPWFKSPSDWKYFKLAEADRTALVLRHPFDSALSEYKR